jgi:UDP-N-acetylglucosamine 2-epimerase (non-hydrolysing)
MGSYSVSAVFVLGTRPEIIKLYPVIARYLELGLGFSIIHTNQHYSPELDRVFFEQLHLPAPQINLNAGTGSSAEQLARMLPALRDNLTRIGPDTVYVQGDTNSVLAGALAAAASGIPVAHVESGLRSHDRRMPEEYNRVMADNLSSLLLAPTEGARQILLSEGFGTEKICVTGNTVVDTLLAISCVDHDNDWPGERWKLARKHYFLVTLHRAENVDNPAVLVPLLDAVDRAAAEAGMPALFPIHPRTRARIGKFGITTGGNLHLVDPVGYLEFVRLERHAALVITDSGGVQEEACVLGVPCVTARLTTERPETVDVGANEVAGTDPVALMNGVRKMLGRNGGWENPFGDGRAGERIVEIVLEKYSR